MVVIAYANWSLSYIWFLKWIKNNLRAKLELLINPIKKMSSRNIEMNSIARKIWEQKKNTFRCHFKHFTIRFKFNAVADKRQCSFAASKPLRNKCFKLCRAFCTAKLPSHQIWRSRNTSRCRSLPSLLWFCFTAGSNRLTCTRRLAALLVRHWRR